MTLTVQYHKQNSIYSFGMLMKMPRNGFRRKAKVILGFVYRIALLFIERRTENFT